VINHDLKRGIDEIAASRDEYDRAETYYKGRQQEIHASRALAKIFRADVHRFNVNFSARPVDAVLDRLEVTTVTAMPSSANSVLTTALWTDNSLDEEIPEILKSAAMFGDAYVFVQPDEEGQGVEIWLNDPRQVRVFYDEENPRRKSYVIKKWEIQVFSLNGVPETRTRINLYYPDRTEKYISRAGGKPEDEAAYEPYVDDTTDEIGVAENPYGELQWFHFRTERPYGRPEHFNAFDPQDLLTRHIISQVTASEFAAGPQRWAIKEASAGTGDNEDDLPEDVTAAPHHWNEGSQFESHPGNVWLTDGIKQFGQFAAAEARNFLEPMAFYVRVMSSVTSTPLHYFDPVGDAPSGQSLRALEAPLIKKVRARQVSFGSTLRETLTFALTKILGIAVDQINIHWANAQVVEDKDYWDAVNAKIEAGVPRRRALMDAGFTEIEVESFGYTQAEPNGPAIEQVPGNG